MPFVEYAQYDGLGLADLVARGEVTAEELVEEAIARIEKHNLTLNAVIYKMYDQARKAAQGASAPESQREGGPFSGVPFLLKDILGDHEGVPTTMGSRLMTGIPAGRDQTLVARYKAAGLIPLGKTNAPEFGLLPTTEPALYGASRNPWSCVHSTGGSSGGSAAAVASGMVPIAHANDGGGSIRVPASCCGLVGLKPTRARNPLGPTLGDYMGGLVAEHVVTRTVRDSAAVLDCTHGPEPGDPYCAPAVERPFLEEVATSPGRLRIAYSIRTLTGNPAHAECVAAVEATAQICEELGHALEEAEPDINRELMIDSFMTLWASGLAMNIDAFTMIHGRVPGENDLEPLTRGLYEQGKQITASQYQMAIALIQILSREVARFHQDYDCWLTSTLARPPVENGVIDIHERDASKVFGSLQDYMAFTPLENATGQPAVSLPLHWTADGLPVGVMFAGRFGDEATLFRLAGQLEQARPWIDRKPPIWD
jgi:amidase